MLRTGTPEHCSPVARPQAREDARLAIAAHAAQPASSLEDCLRPASADAEWAAAGASRQGPRAHTCAWARRSWPRPITRTVTQPAPQRCAPQQCDTLQKDELRASAGHGSAGLAVDSVRAYSRARIS